MKIFIDNEYDILSVNRIRTYPHGLDFEIFTKEALQISWTDIFKMCNSQNEFYKKIIPPTKYMLERKKFKNYDLSNDTNLSQIRLTLDYPEDLELITTIYEQLYPTKKDFSLNDIILLLKMKPELLTINKKYSGNYTSLNTKQ